MDKFRAQAKLGLRLNIAKLNSILVVCLLITQPIALHISHKPVSVALLLVAMWLLCVVGPLSNSRSVWLSKEGLYLYLGLVLLVSAQSFIHLNWGRREISFVAYLYFIVLYLFVSLASAVHVTQEGAKAALSAFTLTVSCLGFVALLQIVAQLVGFGFFDYAMLPDRIIFGGYNNQIEIDVFGGIYKANGFVFLEPSFLSKFCALALVVELLRGKRAIVIAGLLLGIACSFSGSGLVLLLFTLPFFARIVSIKIAIITGMSILLLLVLLPEVLDQFTGRLSEFANPNSSAYIRFFAPYIAVIHGFTDFDVLIGNGLGTLEDSIIGGLSFFKGVDEASGRAYDVTAVKVLVETGISGLLFYAVFMLRTFSPRKLGWVGFMAFFSILWITTGVFLQAQTLMLMAILGSMLASVGQERLRAPEGRTNEHRRLGGVDNEPQFGKCL